MTDAHLKHLLNMAFLKGAGFGQKSYLQKMWDGETLKIASDKASEEVLDYKRYNDATSFGVKPP